MLWSNLLSPTPLLAWRWRQHVPQNWWYTSTTRHTVTSQMVISWHLLPREPHISNSKTYAAHQLASYDTLLLMPLQKVQTFSVAIYSQTQYITELLSSTHSNVPHCQVFHFYVTLNVDQNFCCQCHTKSSLNNCYLMVNG